MDVRISAVTKRCDNETIGDIIRETKVISGQAAGVCYSAQNYFESSAASDEKSLSRYETTVGNGHHSIAGHSHFTLVLSNIPKLTAMILNSFGVYNTSEKSGRYTIMTEGETDESNRNMILYNKWQKIFKDLIIHFYPDTADTHGKQSCLADKLAIENARYMLSVLAPYTSMEYTVSYRDLCYIIDMCRRFMERYDANKPYTQGITDSVYRCVKELHDNLIDTGLYDPNLYDIYGREIEFYPHFDEPNVFDAEEHIGETYLIKYSCSLVDLAQEQRHRPIKYSMSFCTESYYVPEILRRATDCGLGNYVNEWLNDLISIGDTIPNATLVLIAERGCLDDFMKKCAERLCSRVQYETMKTVSDNFRKFTAHYNAGLGSPYFNSLVERHYKDGKVLPKCANRKCVESGCMCKNALDRIV